MKETRIQKELTTLLECFTPFSFLGEIFWCTFVALAIFFPMGMIFLRLFKSIISIFWENFANYIVFWNTDFNDVTVFWANCLALYVEISFLKYFLVKVF